MEILSAMNTVLRLQQPLRIQLAKLDDQLGGLDAMDDEPSQVSGARAVCVAELNPLIDRYKALKKSLEQALRAPSVASSPSVVVSQQQRVPGLSRPSFSGDPGKLAEFSIELSNYLEHYTDALNTDAARLQDIRACMKGVALVWFAGETFVSVDEFKTALSERFGSPLELDETISSLVDSQSGSTDLRQYLNTFQAIWSRVPPSAVPPDMCWLRVLFLRGLPEPVRDNLRPRLLKCKDPPEFFRTVAVMFGTRKPINSPPSYEGGMGLDGVDLPPGFFAGMSPPPPRREQKPKCQKYLSGLCTLGPKCSGRHPQTTGICWFCGCKDHRRNECPHKPPGGTQSN
jgi:hypothetical protein